MIVKVDMINRTFKLILQDYIKQGLINEKLIENMPVSIQQLIKSPKSVIKKYYFCLKIIE